MLFLWREVHVHRRPCAVLRGRYTVHFCTVQIPLPLMPDCKPQVRLGRLLIALGRSQMRPLSAPTSLYRMSLCCGDLVSGRAAREVSSQLSAPIMQLCNPRHNICTTPT
jgi:hypothetical protein